MTILIDNSTMEATSKCHTMVAMERVLHLKPKAGSPALEAGTAMHKAWDKFFSRKFHTTKIKYEFYDFLIHPSAPPQNRVF